jgi:alanyl-tRNA synthetase
MQSEEIRKRYLQFFEKRGHKVMPSTSLVPENDPSVLFNTAGMLPIVPYLLGEKHPLGNRLISIQKCVRTGDIDDVGDNTHNTFFEMMGNWSLGDYFKKEAIEWSYELLTSKEEGFGLDPQRLYVTCFEGDENAPKDEESASIWQSIFEKNGVSGERIYFLPAKNNWWSPGDNGPCGPDTEMFYDVTGTLNKGLSKEEYLKADEEQNVVEIWNDVFMEYKKKDGKVVGKLETKNVDTGSGLERVTIMIQGKTNVYDTDLFLPILKKIDEFTTSQDVRARRIVADHIRAAVFMIADGVLPSNTDRGYILRRLLRRAVRYADVLGMKHSSLFWIAETVIDKYSGFYSNLSEQADHIKKEIDGEEQKFRKTLEKGIEQIDKLALSNTLLTGTMAFPISASYGVPEDIIIDVAKELKLQLSSQFKNEFKNEFKKHQDLSRTGAEKKFKGGLGDTSQISLKYHTATHLLNAALRQVLGTHVMQKGSNITSERLRFDFSHPEKMTEEQKKKVEELVNDWISQSLPVSFTEMPKAEAEKIAIHAFGDKYGDMVKVYSIGTEGNYISREFCGGPHVENTSTLGTFKIQKEEAVSQGVRRIKAVLN